MPERLDYADPLARHGITFGERLIDGRSVWELTVPRAVWPVVLGAVAGAVLLLVVIAPYALQLIVIVVEQPWVGGVITVAAVAVLLTWRLLHGRGSLAALVRPRRGWLGSVPPLVRFTIDDRLRFSAPRSQPPRAGAGSGGPWVVPLNAVREVRPAKGGRGIWVSLDGGVRDVFARSLPRDLCERVSEEVMAEVDRRRERTD